MTHSKPRHAAAKAKKAKPAFPLFRHASGRWAKKVKGRFCYFGKVADDPEGKAALARWEAEKEDLLAGRRPNAKPATGPAVADVCDQFLQAKAHLADTGEIARRTFRDYHTSCARIVEVFGKETPVAVLTAADFLRLKKRMAKSMSLSSIAVEIQKTRAVFNWAAHEDTRLIERVPQFGREFRSPTAKALARAKVANGNARRMFEADEIRRMIETANVPFKAMILLGVNCGFGNSDCATLTLDALDLEAGWIDHPRPKTGVERRCPLWPETVETLRQSLAKRRKPRDKADAKLFFLTQQGRPWVRLAKKKKGGNGWEDAAWTDAVVTMTADLLRKLKLDRKGRGFYALRHVFETIGGESLDQVAVNHIMGHTDPTMAAVYRERISDERLRAVSDHVRAWLFGEKEAQ